MFPLHTETPEEGITLEQLFHTDSDRISAMVTQLKQTAISLGLAFGDRHMTYNSRKAQELGIWAEEKGLGHAFHMAVFKAYFAKGLNIAQKDILLDIARQSGLDSAEAEQILTTKRYADDVEKDWEIARSKGIQAAPTFVIGDNHLVGAQNYQTLRDFLLQNSKNISL